MRFQCHSPSMPGFRAGTRACNAAGTLPWSITQALKLICCSALIATQCSPRVSQGLNSSLLASKMGCRPNAFVAYVCVQPWRDGARDGGRGADSLQHGQQPRSVRAAQTRQGPAASIRLLYPVCAQV